MTCAPPSGTKDGTWHWLDRPEDGEKTVMLWHDGDLQGWPWESFDRLHRAKTLTDEGWRYHSPVPTPEEVEALRRLARAIEDHRVDDVPHWLQEACRRAGLWKLQAHGSNLGRYQTNELTDLGRRALGQERNET